MSTVVSVNDYPVGVYSSEEKAAEAIQQIKSTVSQAAKAQYPGEGEEAKYKREVYKSSYHISKQTFTLNEAPSFKIGISRQAFTHTHNT